MISAMTLDLPETYLDLVKKSLTCSLYEENDGTIYHPRKPVRAILPLLIPINVRLTMPVSSELRSTGKDWPALAVTMVGTKRLDNIQHCVTTALKDDIPGDLIETGIWRGGSVILMRAILKAYGDTTRTVYGADSFEGLPKPDARYAADKGDKHWTFANLAVSLDQVRANVERFGLLDEQVQFLKGWFKDTLPAAPINQLAVARLDGDMYESTMTAIENLYPKLSTGGFLIVDDYGALKGCRQAIEDYRGKHGITEPIEKVDHSGVFWRKQS
jgi:O-methyltransferase